MFFRGDQVVARTQKAQCLLTHTPQRLEQWARCWHCQTLYIMQVDEGSGGLLSSTDLGPAIGKAANMLDMFGWSGLGGRRGGEFGRQQRQL